MSSVATATRPAGKAQAADPAAPAARTNPVYLHQNRLLQAMHNALPVLYAGRQRFIQCITYNRTAGNIDCDVYLAGDGSNSVSAPEVSFPERIE